MNRYGKRLALSGIALLGAGAITTAAIPSASAGTQVLQFTGIPTSFTAIPERSGAGATQHAGDQSFFVISLSQDGHAAGRAPHHCVAVDANYAVCTSVAVLSGGQITMQTALEATSTSSTLVIAVTGGTGTYRGATGQLRVVRNADGSQSWTFDLTTPN
ncbi:MAG TPA: hypothetical protein VE441_09500 [Mycobacterium sp.]|jgi:hypothetical protein|nr:hypothetical protein [Mycobacterium sp.]